MSLALIGTIDAFSQQTFDPSIDPASGFFYMMAIELRRAIIASSPEIDKIKPIFVNSNKPIIAGSFWEEFLDYRWWDMAPDNLLEINVTGKLAFALDDENDVEGDDLEEGRIRSLVIAWAEDGDSPKRFPTPVGVTGFLFNCSEDREFDFDFDGL
jgi:hypothetical protein